MPLLVVWAKAHFCGRCWPGCGRCGQQCSKLVDGPQPPPILDGLNQQVRNRLPSAVTVGPARRMKELHMFPSLQRDCRAIVIKRDIPAIPDT